MSFGDETTKIILNTKGTVGEISEDLKATLRYIDGENPKSEYTMNLKNEVEDVRISEKWRREYMMLMMRDKQNKKLGRYESVVSFVRELYGEIDDSRIMSMARITQEE